MPDLWRDLLDEKPTEHTPTSTGKAWSLQTSRQPTGDEGNTHNANREVNPLQREIMGQKTAAWIYRSRADVTEVDECKFCGDPAVMNASWKITNGELCRGYLCVLCHSEMNLDVNDHNNSFRDQTA
jgi:hypothetical protein